MTFLNIVSDDSNIKYIVGSLAFTPLPTRSKWEYFSDQEEIKAGKDRRWDLPLFCYAQDTVGL